jgi:hypothetical protein
MKAPSFGEFTSEEITTTAPATSPLSKSDQPFLELERLNTSFIQE